MAMHSILFSFLLLLASNLPTFANEYDVKSVPRPSDNIPQTIDEAHVFSPKEISEMNATLDRIFRETHANVMVVTLPSIGHTAPKQFATDLFNYWKIGAEGVDDGLLILLVTDQRRVEMETGYGLEGKLPDVVLFRIQKEAIIPALTHGTPGIGFHQALKLIESELKKQELPKAGSFSTIKRQAGEQNPLSVLLKKPIAKGIWALLVLLFLYLGWIRFWFQYSSKPGVDPYETYKAMNSSNSSIFVALNAFPLTVLSLFLVTAGKHLWVLAPIFFAYLGFGYFLIIRLSNKLRHAPRDCSYCKEPMTLRNEKEERALESANAAIEEELKVLDYDYWICKNLHVCRLVYEGKRFRDFSVCKECNAHALKVTEHSIIVRPTHSSSGTARLTYVCQACKSISYSEVYLARLKDTVNSSGSRSHSNQRSSGGGSSGGKSGGGGAGSSY